MAKIISQASKDAILAACDLVDLAGQYIEFKKHSGDSHWACCPFHSEKTPSFKVSASQKRYYCFGCHASGDAIEFVRQMERVDFPTACELLAERLGLRLQYENGPVDRDYELKKQLKLIHLEAARLFYRQLQSPEGRQARDYLELQRGLSRGIIQKFGLGYASRRGNTLYQHLRDRGFAEEAIMASGLVKESPRGPADLFYHRVIFPIFDSVGAVIAFGGRVLDDGLPKYVNSPETPIFSKGREIYALNFAKKSQRLRPKSGPVELRRQSERPRLIVCEGYLDVLALNQAGFDNVVAGLGTALTESQIKYLQSLSPELNLQLCYDGDKAGQTAAFQAMLKIQKTSGQLSIVSLPPGLDPDDYLKKYGRERFAQLLETALTPVDFVLKLARQSATDEDGVMDVYAYNERALDAIARYETEANLELRIASFAKEMELPIEGIRESVYRLRRRVKSRDNEEQAHLPRPAPPVTQAEAERVLYGLIFKQIPREDYAHVFTLKSFAPAIREFLISLLREYTGVEDLEAIQDPRLFEAAMHQIEALEPVKLLSRADAYHLENGQKLSDYLTGLELSYGLEQMTDEESRFQAQLALSDLSAQEDSDLRRALVQKLSTSHDYGQTDQLKTDLAKLQALDLAKLKQYQDKKATGASADEERG